MARYQPKQLNVNDEWYTPQEWLDKAREVMGGIDLDPASHEKAQETVQAGIFYTNETNGLDKPWHGRVWCNPPYSAALIKQFTKKFYEEYCNGNMSEGIILTNSGTDTLWNQNLVEGIQAYTLGRISFVKFDGSQKAPGSRGQCFTYLGPNHQEFIKVFTRDNKCWVPNLKLIDPYDPN